MAKWKLAKWESAKPELANGESAKALARYPALGLDKLATHLLVLTLWPSDVLSFECSLDRQAFPMVWDQGEVNPFSEARGPIPPHQHSFGGRRKMRSLEEIKTMLQQHKEELRAKYKVKEIGVFGSYVRGEQKKQSDIDILVEFEVVPGLLKFIELEHYLSELLGIKVDLVRKSSIREELGDTILQEMVVV